MSWRWDPAVYEGSAAYYAVGRMPSPAAIAGAFRDKLGLDGSGRLLDVGCGPGTFTLVVAGLYEETVGVDADAGMLGEAARRAADMGSTGVRWVRSKAEEMPDDLGRFRTATLAQSFHWMDQPRVAARLLDLLDAGGTLVFVGATTHMGMVRAERPGPPPPWAAIDALKESWLGPAANPAPIEPPADAPNWETVSLSSAGFLDDGEVIIPGGDVLERDENQVVAAVFSLSTSSPHLFGDRVDAFEADLRAVLRRAAPDGRFWEATRPVSLRFWKRPDHPRSSA
jgi:SAM-dependent methyltransferase